MQLKDVPAGTICYTQERISATEVRETWYYREDRETRYRYNVGVVRLAVAQGEPGAPPRYLRIMDPPCRDPGEADGRVPVKVDGRYAKWTEAVSKGLRAENCNVSVKNMTQDRSIKLSDAVGLRAGSHQLR